MLRKRHETRIVRPTIASLALSVAIAAPLHAQAVPPPVAFPVCVATADQELAAVAADGRGGAFIAWLDQRASSAPEVYVQCVVASGAIAAGWPENGTLVRRSPIAAGSLAVIADDRGGAFVVWRETQADSPDLFAQHVDAVGRIDPRWPADGLLVCGAAGAQSDPVLVADGRGGTFVVWTDHRLGLNSDIYAQHILQRGALDPIWPADGRSLCNDESTQRNVSATPDGRGGFIAAWEDSRAGDYADIWAQRVDAALAVAWGATGLEICYADGDQQLPMLAADGAGGAIIVWQDRRGLHYDLYATRIAANATTPIGWVENGNVVCIEPGGQFEPQIVSDGAGGALFGWFDDRSGGFDIYAQRLSATGGRVPGWEPTGLPVCTVFRNQTRPRLASDGESGAYIVWTDWRPGSHADVYAQRVSALGIVPAGWPAGGVVVGPAPGNQSAPLVAGNDRGRAVVAWDDAQSGTSVDIYAAPLVLGAAGASAIADGACASAALGDQSNPGIDPARWLVADGVGGAYVAWEERRTTHCDIVLQRLGTDGAPAPSWPENGIMVCDAAGDQTRPYLCPDGFGGVLVAWQDARTGTSQMQIYVQRLDAAGQIVDGWPVNGRRVSLGTFQMTPVLVADGTGGAFVGWVAKASAGDMDIWVQRLTQRGDAAAPWSLGGRAACGAPLDQTDIVLLNAPPSGVLVFWSDARGTHGDVFGVAMNGDGTIRAPWSSGGDSFAPGAGRQHAPVAIEDGAGGALLAWLDTRDGNAAPYLQRVTGSRSLVIGWPARGVPLASGVSGDASDLRLVRVELGTAIVAWMQEEGSTSQIRLQRIDSAGYRSPGWPQSGLAASTDPGPKVFPALANDPAGGAVVSWIDLRNGAPDVYAQEMTASGMFGSRWPPAGLPVCTAAGVQTAPAIVSDLNGRVFTAWVDHRDATDDVYATAFHAALPVTSAAATPFVPGRSLRLVAEPNPFRGTTRLDWSDAAGVTEQAIRIEIFDVAGARVRELGTSIERAARRIVWDGRTDAGLAAPSGVYFVRARRGGQEAVVKLVRSE